MMLWLSLLKTGLIAHIVLYNSFPQSYKEQWINQEIGYAIGVGKKVAPIIGETVLDKLKGFVHKQNQCPYTYKPNKVKSKSGENKVFMQKFRWLLADLEEEVLADNKESEEKTNKSDTKHDRPRFVRMN